MSIHPDIVYDKSRLDLIAFEDIEFSRLISNIPNYYLGPNEEPIYGAILKAIAVEMGRLEYDLNYDIVSRNPQYLTPSDIRRRWESAVHLNKNYPTKKQYDRDYRKLVIDLMKAYRQGARIKTIQDVVKAYTGFESTVIELFTRIGDRFYDESDRNSINVSVATPSDNLSDTIQIVTRDLSTAINLAKPAHVGINLAALFQESPDDLDTFITDITDELRIFVKLSEEEPLENPFILAPFEDPEKESTLAGAGGGQGLLAPQLDRVWEITDDQLFGVDLD